MKTLSEQVDLLEVNNRNTIYQMKKWREHAESLELRLDNLIDERDETLVNRDIAEDLVDELKNGRNGLQEEVDNLAEENKNFAEHLERMDYTPCEIDDIANGWDIDKDKGERIADLEHRLKVIMQMADYNNEEK